MAPARTRPPPLSTIIPRAYGSRARRRAPPTGPRAARCQRRAMGSIAGRGVGRLANQQRAGSRRLGMGIYPGSIARPSHFATRPPSSRRVWATTQCCCAARPTPRRCGAQQPTLCDAMAVWPRGEGGCPVIVQRRHWLALGCLVGRSGARAAAEGACGARHSVSGARVVRPCARLVGGQRAS